MRPDSMDELTVLARRARQGDGRALEHLVSAVYPDVRKLCSTLVGTESAEDLAQETLVRVVRAMPGFRGESSARTWVLAICRRVCMDELRRRSRHARRERALAEVADRSGAEVGSPAIEIRDLLAELEPERRAAFALTQLLRLSYAEAATVCSCPTGTIRSRVARARDDLIRLLGRQPVHEGADHLYDPPGRVKS